MKMKLNVSEDDEDVAYLVFPMHPGEGEFSVVKTTIRLHDLLDYIGPDIYLDLDEKGKLIGAEILV